MTNRLWILLTMIAVGLALTGCGGSGSSYEEPAAPKPAASVEPAAKAPAGDAQPTEAMLAKLMVADGADGAADQVVAKCPGCSLAMEGSADHALQVGDYALHFCSDSCRDNFSQDVEASLVAMVVPDAEGVVKPKAKQ